MAARAVSTWYGGHCCRNGRTWQGGFSVIRYKKLTLSVLRSRKYVREDGAKQTYPHHKSVAFLRYLSGVLLARPSAHKGGPSHIPNNAAGFYMSVVGSIEITIVNGDGLARSENTALQISQWSRTACCGQLTHRSTLHCNYPRPVIGRWRGISPF